MSLRQILCGFATVLAVGSVGRAGGPPTDPAYRIVSPSNTGIPGLNNMMFVAFGPDGRLWTHGRDFFWQQGGVAALDFTTSLWKTYSSAETPLDQWSYNAAFAADGSVWIAGDDVVARLHPDGDTFTAYTPGGTGVLVAGSYGDISIAPNGHVWTANYGQVDLGGGLFEFDGTIDQSLFMGVLLGQNISPDQIAASDMNGDGTPNGLDVKPFVTALIN